MKSLSIIILIMQIALNALSQQTVTFTAADGVTVTADQYIVSTQNSYLILLHQAGYSRGEYRETAPKLANLGFNCLAVDLRSGNEVNFVKNRTAADAQAKGKGTDYLDTRADIAAAIEYVASRTNKPIILVGSSYSASLALIEATENFKVKAVVVFSPGEYFGNELSVKQETKKLFVPVLSLSTRMEFPVTRDMLSHLRKKHLNLFQPSMGEGMHGSKALWESNPNHQEYWMALTQFFSQLKLK